MNFSLSVCQNIFECLKIRGLLVPLRRRGRKGGGEYTAGERYSSQKSKVCSLYGKLDRRETFFQTHTHSSSFGLDTVVASAVVCRIFFRGRVKKSEHIRPSNSHNCKSPVRRIAADRRGQITGEFDFEIELFFSCQSAVSVRFERTFFSSARLTFGEE